MTIQQPPSPVKNWEMLLSNTWSWAWLPPVFPSSLKVRVADMDGWVSQGSQLLLIDGQIGRPNQFKPSQAVKIAVRDARNITYLALAADDLDPATHEPLDITHYNLHPGPWPAHAWTHKAWAKLPDAEGHWQVCALVAQWAAWAHYVGPEAAS